MVIDREVQRQIHAERLIGQRTNLVDLLAEEGLRAELRLQDTEAPRVADRGDQCRARQVGTHRRGDDRIFDASNWQSVVFMRMASAAASSKSLKPLQEVRELIQQGPLRVWTARRFEDEEDPLESQLA